MPGLEWERIRKRSPSVQDFADNLARDVRKLPAGQRATTYQDTLRNISPLLEQRVADEAQLWVDRGYDPARALKAATYGALIGRRRALFHDLFTRVAEESASKVMRALDESPLSSRDKGEALDLMFSQLRAEPLLSHQKTDGEMRLRETGMPEWFIQWALTRKPLDVDDIKAEINANMSAGMDGREALRRGIVLAIREFTLDNMMAVGVAKGTDFCVWASAVSAAVGVIVSVVGMGVSLARSAQAGRDQRTAASRAEADYYLYPMSDEEIDLKVATFRDRGLNKAASRSALIDYMRSVRQGRQLLLPGESQAFEDAWRDAEETAAALRAAQQSKADLPRKIIAYGAPVLGVLVLGYALLR